MNGLANGFPMGMDPSKVDQEDKISGEGAYIALNGSQKQGISNWVLKYHGKEFMAGPFDLDHKFDFGKLFIAPLFVVPKPDGSWRPIVHFSYQAHGKLFSINDCLCEYMKTVQYVSFKEVVQLVNNAGKGAYLFLIDAEEAYYRVPVRKEDWKFMGIKWAKKYWIFRSLQMGCSSSPKIYTEFADSVEYICVNKDCKLFFINNIQQLRHYIDDFFGAHPTFKGALKMFKIVFKTFEELGIPTRPKKCFYPATKRKILGWVYDTVLQVAGVPDDKRQLLITMLSKLQKTKKSDRKTMEQLIGRLQNVSLVIFPGKAFVRRLEAALHLLRFDYNIPFGISNFVLEDAQWWLNILHQPHLCCSSFDLLLKHPSDGDFQLWSDATTTIGGGGYAKNKKGDILFYYQFNWEQTYLYKTLQIRELDINVRELLLSLVGIILLTPHLTNKCVTIYNDNPAAAGAIRTKAPRLYRMDMQCLIRALALQAIENQFYFWGIHYTVKNGYSMKLADKLSRFDYTNEFHNIPFIDAIPIVNKLLLKLKHYPLNLPSNIDIDDQVRAAFGLLLDDDTRNNNNPNLNRFNPSKNDYNILNCKIKERKCAL